MSTHQATGTEEDLVSSEPGDLSPFFAAALISVPLFLAMALMATSV